MAGKKASVLNYAVVIKTCTFANVMHILFMWKCSVFKMVWFEVAFFSILYAVISAIYRFLMPLPHRHIFEKFCLLCRSFLNTMPVSFILGFYVSMVVKRWWTQFRIIPWPDGIALHVNSCITGNSSRVLKLRANIIRYINATLLLFFRSVSTRAKRIYLTEADVKLANLLTEEEFSLFLSANENYNRYHIPSLWATNLARKAFEEGLIKSEIRYQTLILEISQFRARLNSLFMLNWVNPPLVYTQTATIAVYIYALLSLFGHQYLPTSTESADMVVPIFTLIQLAFYFGWLKTAEALVNPFGEDDDDFECVRFLRRNLKARFPIMRLYEDTAPPPLRDPTMDDDPSMMSDLINDEYLVWYRQCWKI